MGDKDVGYFGPADLVIDHLDLGAFATIHKKVLAIQCYHLAGRMSVKCRYSGVISKDRDCEHEIKNRKSKVKSKK
jgi:hypothetical protein